MASTAESAPARFAVGRVYRLMTLSLSVATVIEVASVVSGIIGDAAFLTPGFTITALALILAPSLAGLAAFARAPLASLRAIWRVQALAMLAVYAAIPLVLSGSRLPALSGLPWPAELEVIAGCAAVLAWRVRTAIGYAVVWQAVMFTTAITGVDDPFLGLAVGDALRQLFYVAMFMGLTVALTRAGRLLDVTIDRAVSDARAAADAQRRRTARERVEMLIHDRIIVALLAYANGTEAKRSAQAATAALAAMRDDSRSEHEPVTPRALAWELQALTTRQDPGIRFDWEASGTTPIPAEVATALTEALAEALRNSLRHAGPRSVHRQVRAAVSDERIAVFVLDDGRGFDTAAVPATRLGIRHGLVRRMHGVAGGSASVASKPGYGTAVTLTWSRP